MLVWLMSSIDLVIMKMLLPACSTHLRLAPLIDILDIIIITLLCIDVS